MNRTELVDINNRTQISNNNNTSEQSTVNKNDSDSDSESNNDNNDDDDDDDENGKSESNVYNNVQTSGGGGKSKKRRKLSKEYRCEVCDKVRPRFCVPSETKLNSCCYCFTKTKYYSSRRALTRHLQVYFCLFVFWFVVDFFIDIKTCEKCQMGTFGIVIYFVLCFVLFVNFLNKGYIVIDNDYYVSQHNNNIVIINRINNRIIRHQ